MQDVAEAAARAMLAYFEDSLKGTLALPGLLNDCEIISSRTVLNAEERVFPLETTSSQSPGVVQDLY